MPSKIKIAVVEDNDDLRSLLLRNIEREGYTVFGADSAESLDDLLIDHVFNLIILDLNLPSEDGISIATRLKKADHDLYIIMATARNSAEARVAGYESGADIYLTKPFSSAELLAAIGSLARRLSAQKMTYQAHLHLPTSTLVGKHAIDLNKNELAILKGLAEAPSQKLPYYRLIEIVGDEVNEVSKATLDVRISRLKKKFTDAGILNPAIKVNRAEGYQLVLELKLKN